MVEDKEKKDIPKVDKVVEEQKLDAISRQEQVNAKTEELLIRQEKLYADDALGGTVGGQVRAKRITPEEQATNAAAEFFEGTQLGKDIKKANKKDE